MASTARVTLTTLSLFGLNFGTDHIAVNNFSRTNTLGRNDRTPVGRCTTSANRSAYESLAVTLWEPPRFIFGQITGMKTQWYVWSLAAAFSLGKKRGLFMKIAVGAIVIAINFLGF
jgi:hypothetical protein